jgi:hypothetical protein
MELRTVLTKKHRLERDRAAAVEDEVRSDVEVVVPAQEYDATLVSFDGELIDPGAEHPADVIVG